MYLAEVKTSAAAPVQRRKFSRREIQCHARIRIGNRQYAGYLHNISPAGARLRTITAIRKVGHVTLRLPDLPPLRCCLRWSDSHNAGVAFDVELSTADLNRWIRSRSAATAVQECVIDDWVEDRH